MSTSLNSASNNNNKRKRLNSRSTADIPVEEAQQPTSGEEADAELSYDSAPTAGVGAATSSTRPPPESHAVKRTKRRASMTDDGERSSTTEASSAIEERVREGAGRKTSLNASVRTNSNSSAASGASGSGIQPDGSSVAPPPMDPPQQAGALAPAGYSMNPPPTDRAVRIYADGVFDLFHLG